MPEVTLSAGTIHYEKSGPPTGRPVVFIHGYAMASSLWRPLSERLAEQGYACYAPTWPLGAHTEPMVDRAKVTMEGIAGIVAEFLERLELTDVVLVGNDTGGAIAQIVATTTPARLGALVLTSCDAFEHFPPPVLKPFINAARLGPTFHARSRRCAPGWCAGARTAVLAHADIEQLAAEWVKPALTDPTESARICGTSPHRSIARRWCETGARLPEFTKPALIAWSGDDTFFPCSRTAAALPTRCRQPGSR